MISNSIAGGSGKNPMVWLIHGTGLESGDGTASQIKSNDHHMLALAIVSGSRLLYSNDKDLQKDFGNIQLLGSPKGRVYSTAISDDFSRQRQNLLARSDLCTRRGSCS